MLTLFILISFLFIAPTSSEEEISPVPTCIIQEPCLEFVLDYDDANEHVTVTVKYDSAMEGCIKEDGEVISNVCFNEDALIKDESGATVDDPSIETESVSGEKVKIEDFESGWSIEETFPCDCVNSISVQMAAFTDEGECGSYGGLDDQIRCRSSSVAQDFCEDGNDDQCVYEVRYKCCQWEDEENCCDTALVLAIADEKEDHMNVFDVTFIYLILIVIGIILLMVFIVGMIWFYIARVKSQRLEKEKLHKVLLLRKKKCVEQKMMV